MNRRSLIAGTLASLAVCSLPAQADPGFVVNQWTDGKPVPQCVRRSEIRECVFINSGDDRYYDWVEIETHDGRTIQSELAGVQDLKPLLRQLSEAGVPIINHDRPMQKIAHGVWAYNRGGKFDTNVWRSLVDSALKG